MSESNRESFYTDSITVVEIGERKAAGAAGSLLAQLGCRVVLVEPTRGKIRDDAKWSTRAQFAGGKHSVVIDDTLPDDLALLASITGHADIVITSSDVDRLPVQVVTDTTVHCDVTAFGAGGPLSGQACSDLQIQALSAMMDTTGMPDADPLPAGADTAEFTTGIYAAIACTAALSTRQQSGTGQFIDMALFDCAFSTIATFLPKYFLDPGSEIRRAGNRHPLTGPWNVYGASDGWVLICTANDGQWQRLCQIMDRPDLASTPAYKTTGQRMECMPEIDAQIHQWAGQRTVEQCVAAFEGTNVASGPIAPLDQFPQEANLEHRAMVRQIVDKQHGRPVYVPGSPIRCTHSAVLRPADVPAPDDGRDTVLNWLRTAPDNRGSTRLSPSANADLPLKGIRVVEIGHYTTAPLSARHLASLGAEVIKIEPRGGEGMRAWPPSKAGQGIFFTYTNTNKKSMALDLNSATGESIFATLIHSADVLIENLKPGALAKRGFSWEQLSALNPRLIYCAISGFGEDTIYTGRAAFDTVIQAMCGLMAANLSNGVPVKAGISSADLMGAQLCVLNVLAALAARERTGRGEFFDLAMQDVAAWATQTVWNLSPEELNRPRHQIVDCADGVIAVAGGSTGTLAPEESTHLSREQAAAAINASGGRAAPVLSVAEVAQHAQTIARGLMFEAIDYRDIRWPMMASPLRLSATPPRVNEPMGELGRQTAAVLRSIGLDPDDPEVSVATASA